MRPMAFFRYRDIDVLRADIAARGVALDLADDLSPLAAPLRIGHRTASNRMAVHPMEGCDGNADGTPGELTFRRWRRFAAGGAAVLWGEATAVVPEARANTRQLLLTDDTAPAIARLLAAAREARRERFGHDDGFLVGVQLTHSGRWSAAGAIVAHRAPAVDAVRGAGIAPVSDGALDALAERFEHAAALAADIGFDFIDIKQCHTYLLNELLASRDRAGRYGGDFAGRTRFVRDVFVRVRSRVGPGVLLATRLNVFDGPPYAAPAGGGRGAPAGVVVPYRAAWGTDAGRPTEPDLTEPLALIAALRPLGLALVNVTMGSPYFNPHIGRPFERAPVDGYAPPEHPLEGVARHVRLTAEVRHANADLAVIGSGYSWLRHYAMHAGAANVAANAASIVGLGRGALAYPEFANDVLAHGAMERDRSCLGVSYCTALMRAKHNAEGQYAAGCAPRDPMYADAYKAALVTEGWR
ncbi:MAG: NADH:flavin oxidoreductase [Chloroflexi bacterium]|nr:NADH:flavin oxidoreductase [Chloroflexota bacterium]